MKLQSMSSRWLAGMALVILVLIVVSVVVALVNRQREVDPFSLGTPEATAQKYLLALEEEDLRNAYEYLSPALQERCDFQHFWDTSREERMVGDTYEDMRLTLEGTQPINGSVEVRVEIEKFQVSAPIEFKGYSHTQRFTLEQLGGTWRFVEPPWPMYRCPEA